MGKLSFSLSYYYSNVRTFKRFNKDAFLFDLNCAPFCDVYKFKNPDDALSVWYNIIMPIINVHAPLRKKRVKHAVLPPGLIRDVIPAMAVRDCLKKEKRFQDFKKRKTK